jgi:copper homeostasis protein
MKLEICVDTLASVAVCAAAGAHRIELCAGLVEGGTTPSLGFLRAARRSFPGKIMAMVRPRAGDFHYDEAEFAQMLDEIDLFRREGADGVVFGILEADGRIDWARSREFVSRAAGLDVTFHRAFDVTPSLTESLEALVALGVPRVLTSGGQPDVYQGSAAIAALREQAAGRITILPGGGVKPERVTELIQATGVTEVHLSARVSVPSPMRFRRPDIPMGATAVPGEYERKTASAELIRATLAAMAAAMPS